MKKKNRIFSAVFLILAIPFFLLSLVGFFGGSAIFGAFCLLFGLVCFYIHRMMKKEAAEPVRKPVEKVQSKTPQAARSAADHASAGGDDVEIVFPDGHIERRSLWDVVDADEGCLISEGGRTYHTNVGCFLEWLPEYQENFTRWQLISISEAKSRGLRKCNFCRKADE